MTAEGLIEEPKNGEKNRLTAEQEVAEIRILKLMRWSLDYKHNSTKSQKQRTTFTTFN